MSHPGFTLDGVDDEHFDCLNAWPKGTVGRQNDEALIAPLNALCRQHGYGRMAQLVEAMEDLWRHPEKLPEYQAAHDERMQLLEQDKRRIS